jgi:hypothetical protein
MYQGAKYENEDAEKRVGGSKKILTRNCYKKKKFWSGIKLN